MTAVEARQEQNDFAHLVLTSPPSHHRHSARSNHHHRVPDATHSSEAGPDTVDPCRPPTPAPITLQLESQSNTRPCFRTRSDLFGHNGTNAGVFPCLDTASSRTKSSTKICN